MMPDVLLFVFKVEIECKPKITEKHIVNISEARGFELQATQNISRRQMQHYGQIKLHGRTPILNDQSQFKCFARRQIEIDSHKDRHTEIQTKNAKTQYLHKVMRRLVDARGKIL